MDERNEGRIKEGMEGGRFVFERTDNWEKETSNTLKRKKKGKAEKYRTNEGTT